MATNDFLVFGGGSSPNVIDQATYAVLAARLSGFVSGTAQSQQLNKVWRQSSIMSAVLAQFIVDHSGQSAVDDGTITTLEANLLTAIQNVVSGQTRIRLTGNLTLYVSPTGSDSNNGLTAATPFLTLQKAWNVLQLSYDLNGFTATVQVANGTYSGVVAENGPVPGALNASSIVFNGSGAPSNVVINAAASTKCFSALNGGQFSVSGMTLQGGAGAQGLSTDTFSSIWFSNVAFGAMPGGTHISGNALAIGAYSITGGAGYHLLANQAGINANITGQTVTLTGTPAFATAFAVAQFGGLINVPSAVFSGSATGTRYIANLNGIINTNGAGATFLPGNAAGSTATGGIYN